MLVKARLQQAAGETDRVGPWTDVWGLGAVLYECLSGSPPFWGKDVLSVLESVIHSQPRPLDAVRADSGLEPLPADLVTICSKALEKERDRRYTTAAALEEDLRRWLDGRPILSRPSGKGRRALDALKRSGRAVALGLAVAAAATVASILIPGALERSRRLAHAADVLARVGTGEGKYIREKAVFELTREKDSLLVPFLVEALDKVTARMGAVTREQLLSVETAVNAEERARQPRLARLREALDRLEAARRDARVERERVRAVDEARRRYRLRGFRSGQSAGIVLASDQKRRVGDEDLLRALVAVEALGRLGDAAAVDAVGRHLHVCEDEERGVAAAQALGRLRHARAARSVLRVDERFARGGSYESRALHALAFELGGAVPDFEPKTALDFMDRGRLRALLDDRSGALLDLNQAVGLDAKDPFVWSTRAALHANKHDWVSSCADLEKAMALEPDVASHLAGHAYGLCQRDEKVRALAEADRAIELDNADARTWSSRGAIKVKLKDRAGALSDLSRALELDRNLAEPWASRASLRAEDDPQGAIEDNTRALELDPNMAAVWNNRACAKQRKGDLEGALADFGKAIELAPLEAQQFVNRATCHVERSDYPSAIADASKALERDPRSAHALAIRGRSRIFTSDPAGAEADLNRATELAPGDKSVWNALSLFRLSRGDKKGALEAVERQVALAPDDADALTSRGFIRMKAGDVAGARADCERATVLRPLDATCWDNYAEALFAAKDWKLALDASERSIRLGRNHASAWRRNATIKQWLGDYPGALTDATRAVELNSHDFANLFVRAECHRYLGDRDAALKDYKAAVALFGPKDEDPKIIRDRIAELERGGR